MQAGGQAVNMSRVQHRRQCWEQLFKACNTQLCSTQEAWRLLASEPAPAQSTDLTGRDQRRQAGGQPLVKLPNALCRARRGLLAVTTACMRQHEEQAFMVASFATPDISRAVHPYNQTVDREPLDMWPTSHQSPASQLRPAVSNRPVPLASDACACHEREAGRHGCATGGRQRGPRQGLRLSCAPKLRDKHATRDVCAPAVFAPPAHPSHPPHTSMHSRPVSQKLM